jgi:hypothetical protein
VTLAIRDSGGDVEPNDLGAHFEATLRVKRDDPTTRSAGAVISLDEIERILRSGGGDLSFEVEPGLGTTYTVFLPEASPEILAEAKASGLEATTAATDTAESHDRAEAPGPKTQLSFLT